MDNELGAWRGTFYSYSTPDYGRVYHQLNLTGSDGYEGLSASLFVLDNGTSLDVVGMIFPGDLPPMPEMTEPPAE